MVFTSLPMHKKPIPVVLEKIGSYLIPIEEITGTIVNRASYLKRFVGLQKNPRKHKYFEIKTYYQKTGPYLRTISGPAFKETICRCLHFFGPAVWRSVRRSDGPAVLRSVGPAVVRSVGPAVRCSVGPAVRHSVG